MTQQQQVQDLDKTEKNQPQVQVLSRDASELRAYGVTVRRVQQRGPVPRTTFDVIVNTGVGRWNAEMVAEFIRATLRGAIEHGATGAHE